MLWKTFLKKRTRAASVSSMDRSKAIPVGDIPVDMLKVTLDTHLSIITKIINLWFENEYFPDDLKLAILAPGKHYCRISSRPNIKTIIIQRLHQ